MPQSKVVHSPGEQEVTSVTSRKGWTHAADILRKPDTNSAKRVPLDDPPTCHIIYGKMNIKLKGQKSDLLSHRLYIQQELAPIF